MPIPHLKIYDSHHFIATNTHSVSFLSPHQHLSQIIQSIIFQIINWLDVSGHTPKIISEIPTINEVQSPKRVIPCWTDGYIFHHLNNAPYQIALLLHTADCAPITFTSTDGNMLGIIHAWRKGLVWGIIANLATEIQKLWYKPEEITFWIWPMAWDGFEFWKVDFEAKIQPFIEKYQITKSINLQSREEDNKVTFDMKLLLKNVLISQGFIESSINFSPRNTLDTNETLPSWRKGNTERITTIIYK